jgi:diguanylate cyclase (GGDEF)-like protein/PAS domain S-box-containing protein
MASPLAIEIPSRSPPASILIVDDNADKRIALKAMLTSLRHPIVEAESGRLALKAVAEQRFALILMDVRMPVLDGFETARLIRDVGTSQDTPIIFVTAYGGDAAESANAYASGAVDFIFTPVLPDVLRAKVSVFVDLFDQAEKLRNLNTSLRDSDVLTQAVLDNVTDGIFTLDEQGRIEAVNQSVEPIFGYGIEELVGHHFEFMIAPESRAPLEELEATRLRRRDDGAAVSRRVETFGCRRDGTTFTMEMERRQIDHGRRHFTLVSVRDISERSLHREALENLALHDGLTGLANRTLFSTLLSKSLSLAERTNETRGVLVLDLDGFKRVNDTHGHEAGDELLKQAGERLVTVLRGADTVARLGGDEFGILPAEEIDLSAIAAMAWKIQEVFEPGFELNGELMHVPPSIGISLFPEHGRNAIELLHRADLAMYAAKRSGMGQVVFEAAHETQTADHLALLLDLRRCVERDQLCLRYQPQLDVASGRIYGVEALVRWEHPEKGLLSPAEFMDEVERTYLIEPVTRWIMNTALRQQREWAREGLDLTMAVNISARSLGDVGDLPATVAELTERWGTPPGGLTLELTEGGLIQPMAPAILERLHEMGQKLSIDDFGTGYSSLAYLKRLPVDEIKIDRTFVANLTDVGDDAIIVRSTIDLAHNLDLTVVAEGVEDAAVAEVLSGFGCDAVQGYFYGRPVSADQITIDQGRSPAPAPDPRVNVRTGPGSKSVRSAEPIPSTSR